MKCKKNAFSYQSDNKGDEKMTENTSLTTNYNPKKFKWENNCNI